MFEDFIGLCKFSFESKDFRALRNTLTPKLQVDRF